MWNWLNCYLSGRHDYGVTCASGSVFLRCIHCGKRSNGWAVRTEPPAAYVAAATPVTQPPAEVKRALPFVRRNAPRPQQSA